MIRTSLIVIFAVLSFNVNAATYRVLSGTFDIYDTVPNGIGYLTLSGNGNFTEGVYDGSASAIATDSTATYAGIAPADFLGHPIEYYFAATGVYDAPGAVHAAPSIDLVNMTADMSSLFANWNSSPGYTGEFNVGGIATVSAAGFNTWLLNWSTVQVDGPFTGFQTDVSLVVQAVPVPAAVWLMASGILAMFGAARRRI